MYKKQQHKFFLTNKSTWANLFKDNKRQMNGIDLSKILTEENKKTVLQLCEPWKVLYMYTFDGKVDL